MMLLIILITLYFVNDITQSDQSSFKSPYYVESVETKNHESKNETISARIPPLDEIQGVLKVAETVEGLTNRILPLLMQATISLDQIISSVNPNVFGAVAGAFSSSDDGVNNIDETSLRQRQKKRQQQQQQNSNSMILDKILPKN